jgi:hypothetical protein
MRRKKFWIQKSGIRKPGHRGRLHRALGIPMGEKIPYPTLLHAAKASGHLGHMAREALTLHRLAAKRKRRHHHKVSHRRTR